MQSIIFFLKKRINFINYFKLIDFIFLTSFKILSMFFGFLNLILDGSIFPSLKSIVSFIIKSSSGVFLFRDFLFGF